jgi:hypothetical protein
MQIVASLASAAGRGIFGQFKKAITAAQAVGTGREVMICQAPWGPVATLTPFESPAKFRSIFVPDGFDRTLASYNAAVQFPHSDLYIVRVCGAGALAAAINMQKTGPANCVAVTAKYVGTGGNGITCVVAPASNSVANSFKLTITKTNSATGKSTVETYDNVDSTRTDAAYWTALTAKSLLVAALVKSATGRPLDATYTLAGGTDGTGALAASDFVGTPGGGDKGIALLETDKEISFFYCEDVPNSMRGTVNAAMLAHQISMNDRRFAIFTGQSGDDAATAKTNAAALQTEMGAYIWQYGQVIDEDAASDTSPMLTMSLVGPFAALCSILQPHVSPATKRKDFTKALAAIKALVGGTSSSQVLDPSRRTASSRSRRTPTASSRRTPRAAPTRRTTSGRRA